MPEWFTLPPIPSWVPSWAPDVVTAIVLLTGVVVGCVALHLGWRGTKTAAGTVRQYVSSRPSEDILTIVAASIATGVSAQGMWRFSGDVLGFEGPLQLLLFAFIEVAIITSAVRARRNMRENFSAGIDGMAVWALTVLTAVLSSMDARSIPETVFRLAAPLVAAWLWERGMAIERHRATGRKRIHWRLTLERVLVYIGLAEAQDRTAEEVDAQRRLTKVSLAAKKARALRAAGASDRKQRAALTKLDTAFERAAEHAGLARDPEVQKRVRAETASLYSAAGLLDVTPASEWMPAAAPSDFDRLAEETRELYEGLDILDKIRAIRDEIRDSEANILTIASDVTRSATPDVTHSGVTNGVTRQVTNPPFFLPREWTARAPSVTPPATPAVTHVVVAERVTPEVTFDVTNPAVYDLKQSLLGAPAVTGLVTPAVTPPTVAGRVTKRLTFKPKAGTANQPKTVVMRAYWDKIRSEEKRYPDVGELAKISGAHHSLASRKRNEWVMELTYWERRKATPKKAAAVNGSKPSS